MRAACASSTSGCAARTNPRRCWCSCTRAWARSPCGATSPPSCARPCNAAAWSIRAPAMASPPRARWMRPWRRTSCTARRMSCCPPCWPRWAWTRPPTNPGCWATATGARLPCCTRHDSPRALPVPSCWRRTLWWKTCRWPASRRPAPPTWKPICANAWHATTPMGTPPFMAGTASGWTRRFAAGTSAPSCRPSPARSWPYKG